MRHTGDEDAGPASRARASRDRDGELTHSPPCETPSFGEEKVSVANITSSGLG